MINTDSTKRTHFFKVFLTFLILLSSMLLSLDNATAKSYKAKVMVESEPLERLFDSHSGIAIDSNNLIYFASIGGVEGIYKFDIGTETNLLLKAISIDPSDFWTGIYHAFGNGLALLSAKGKLYSSDGTQAGTQLVKDFGFHYCCLSLGLDRSVIDKIDFLNGRFYISTFNVEKTLDPSPYGDPIYRELWVSGGTQQTTKLIRRELAFGNSSTNTRYPHDFNVFSANIEGKVTTLFFTTDFEDQSRLNLWLESDNQSGEPLYKFDEGTIFRPSSVTNSKGTFLCSYRRDSGEKILWRISNSGTVSKIESSCYPGSLSVVSDKLYYTNAQGLWSTSGINSSSTLVFPGTNIKGLMCKSTDIARYLTSEGNILEIKPNSVNEKNFTRLPSSYFVCIDNDIIFYQAGKHVIYDADTEKFSNITNLDGFSGTSSLNILKNNAGDIFTFGATSSDTSEPTYDRVTVIKIKLNEIMMMPILMLLED